MSDEIVLRGLDGTNPLGYLAALGVLRVLSERGHDARLGWRLRDAWRPVLGLPGGSEQRLIEELTSDLEAWRRSAPELELSYEKTTKKTTQTIHELKPPPEVFQAFASAARARAIEGSRRWADHAAGFAAAHVDLGVDNSGQTKPTALHFMAGNQLFLAAVRSLVAELEEPDLEEGCFGPWRYDRELPVLRWDVLAGERDYALRASDPSGDKTTGIPGADWLAFRAMPYFPVMLRNGRAATTGFEGSGKKYTFYWALWSPMVDVGTAQTIVATRWDAVSERERRARGVTLALESAVRRTDQGGYGSFTAARAK